MTLLITETVTLHNSTRQQIEALGTRTNGQIKALNQTLSTRINDLNTSVNREFDAPGNRVDDLTKRTTKLENDVRKVRTLLIERLVNYHAPLVYVRARPVLPSRRLRRFEPLCRNAESLSSSTAPKRRRSRRLPME